MHGPPRRRPGRDEERRSVALAGNGSQLSISWKPRHVTYSERDITPSEEQQRRVPNEDPAMWQDQEPQE